MPHNKETLTSSPCLEQIFFVSLCLFAQCVCVCELRCNGGEACALSLCVSLHEVIVCVCIAHKVSVCVCVCEFRCNGGEACAQNNHCASGHPKETRHKLTLLYAICTKGGGMRGGGVTLCTSYHHQGLFVHCYKI